jgi:signal recognition particle subunit SEC65
MKQNVTIQDIKDIEQKLNITLTNDKRDNVLKEYQRVVMDKAEDWSVIIENIINEIKQ